MDQAHPEIVIIKRHGGSHDEEHGGAWKIAFADFMTAMMAFFLVMWICVQDQKIKRAVATYFQDPYGESPASSKKPGRMGALTEFPDAWHVFDNPLGAHTPTVLAGAQTVRHCTIKEEPKGTIINAVSQQPFTYDDPCVERDPHTAYNEAALTQTQAAVSGFLRGLFQLK